VQIWHDQFEIAREIGHVTLRFVRLLYATLSIVTSSGAPKPPLHRANVNIAR